MSTVLSVLILLIVTPESDKNIIIYNTNYYVLIVNQNNRVFLVKKHL